MAIFKRKPCFEGECIIKHVNGIMNGERIEEEPCVEYPIHKELLRLFNELFDSEKQMASSGKEILNATTELSNLDVSMSFIAEKLISFSQEMSNLSESNLAIVEQTNASMTQVNTTVTDAADTLNELSSSSEELVKSNNEGLNQLLYVARLKEEVLKDANTMKSQIDQLVEMTESINEIVRGVNAIADQTNLLALNASIEAARAGEHGRGFAVVAEEIRKLSDDTKTNLQGMNTFVENIKSVASDGKESMERSISSTDKMSEQIDNVVDTIRGNVSMLEGTIENIKNINNAMAGITLATDEIHTAMDSSSIDAEKLSNMTIEIHEDALISKEYSETIAIIDEKLSTATKEMMHKLSGGKNDLEDSEIVEIIDNAIAAHKIWMTNLKEIVEKMELSPLQVDGHRCSFGHFYHSINMTRPNIKEQWYSIDDVHNELHEYGEKILNHVKIGDEKSAREDLISAQNKSKDIEKIFIDIKAIIEKTK